MYRVLKSRLTLQLNKSRDADQGDRHDQTRLFTIDDGAVGDDVTRCTKYKIHSFYDKVRNNKYTLVDSYYEDFSKTKNAEFRAEGKKEKKYPSGLNPFGSDDEDVLERNQNIEVLIDKSNKKKYPSGFNPFGSDDEDVKKENVELVGNKEKKYPSGINPFGSDEEEVQEENVMNEEVKNTQKYHSGLNPFGGADEKVREGNVETQSEYLDEKNCRCILINSVKGELHKEDIKVKTEEQVRKKSVTHDVFDRNSETVQEGKSETQQEAYGKDQEDIIFKCILKENRELKYPSGLNPFGSDDESVQEEMREIQKWDQKEQMYRYNLIENNQEEVHEEKFDIQSDEQKKNKCRLDLKYNVGNEVDQEKKEEQIEVHEEAQTNMLDYNVRRQSVNKYPTGLNPFGSDEEDFMQEQLEVQPAALNEIINMHNPCDNVTEEFQESKDVPVEMISSYTPFTSDDDEVNEERIKVKGDTGDEEKCTYNPFDSYEVKTQDRELNAYDADDEDDDDYEMSGIMSVNGSDHQDYINTHIKIDPRVCEDYTFGVLGIYAHGQEDRPMNDLYDDMVEEYDGFAYGLLGSARHHLE